jgi:unsaturated chondroitin disaccharide hydrolase
MVPYWDFDAPDIPLAPRDSSAAAIAASGLIDLAVVDPDARRSRRYEAAASDTLASLMSPAYSSFGANPAVLLHGTYLWRIGATDCGMVLGDAFFLEALLRLRRLKPGATPLRIHRARAKRGDARAAVDGDLGTRWVSRGKKALDLRLSRRGEVGAVRVALTRGDNRAALLRIAVSVDGTHWRVATQTMTSGETAGYETLTFAPRDACWVRIACNGTTRGPVNRIAEARVYAAP